MRAPDPHLAGRRFPTSAARSRSMPRWRCPCCWARSASAWMSASPTAGRPPRPRRTPQPWPRPWSSPGARPSTRRARGHRRRRGQRLLAGARRHDRGPYSPPATGPFSGDATAAEVQITRPVRLTFVGFVGAERDITVSRRARSPAWSGPRPASGPGADRDRHRDHRHRPSRAQLRRLLPLDQRRGDRPERHLLPDRDLRRDRRRTTGTCINPTPRSGAAQIDDPLGALPAAHGDTPATTLAKSKFNNGHDPGARRLLRRHPHRRTRS